MLEWFCQLGGSYILMRCDLCKPSNTLTSLHWTFDILTFHWLAIVNCVTSHDLDLTSWSVAASCKCQREPEFQIWTFLCVIILSLWGKTTPMVGDLLTSWPSTLNLCEFLMLGISPWHIYPYSHQSQSIFHPIVMRSGNLDFDLTLVQIAGAIANKFQLRPDMFYGNTLWFELTVMEMTINGNQSSLLTVTVTVTEKFH